MTTLTEGEKRASGRGWAYRIRVMHWVVAVAVVAQVVGALLIPSEQSPLWYVHFSLGITILVLMLARVLVRVVSPPAPALPPETPQWDRVMARVNQIGFYMILIIMPLSGWLLVSMASGSGPTIFGFLTLPPLITPAPGSDPATVTEPYEVLHIGLAWVLGIAIALHLSGALKHALLDKDGVVPRMATLRRSSEEGSPDRAPLTLQDPGRPEA